jgi:hypothetical protein
MMKRGIFFAVAAVLALAGLLYASPYLAMQQIRAAIKAQDSAELSTHIDLTLLRGSLDQQLQALFAAPEVAADISPTVIAPLLDTMLMPEGLISLVQLNTHYESPLSKVSDVSGRRRNGQADYTLHYTAWDEVVVQRAHSKSRIGELTLTRDGLWRWKLSSVALPKNLLADT